MYVLKSLLESLRGGHCLQTTQTGCVPQMPEALRSNLTDSAHIHTQSGFWVPESPPCKPYTKYPLTDRLPRGIGSQNMAPGPGGTHGNTEQKLQTAHTL